MKDIHLENYRCFANLQMHFAKHINLLVGDNASGKTSLLLALRTAMSSFFLGYSDENTRFIGLAKNDFSLRDSETSYLNELPVKVSFDFGDYIEGQSVEARGYIELKSKKSRTSIAGAKHYKAYSHEIYNTLFDEQTMAQTKSLPLFASFSTEDIHATRKLESGKFKEYKHKPSFGYYECLQGDGLLKYWLNRLLVLAEKNPQHPEIIGVRNAIRTALGENGCNIISDIEVRPFKKSIFYKFIDGREVEAQNLSDGYKRLVNIVMALAFRCLLLNRGIYGFAACEQTKGTVLIDEIDLHLHPTLQACVVKSLTRTFPNLQFIITTHAPMVMSGVSSNDDNVVYKMLYTPDDGYEQRRIDPYGMDVSTIIGNELGLIPRDRYVQSELDILFEYINEEKFEKAKEKLQTIRQHIQSKLPELTKAETMISLMEEPFDEKDC
ncbi:AAA family ATPase [Alistipes indistinctus]|uniref:AAA family ATPase n=1 Tax=Alistipes indistinctus TaxID=626932 RepID=UPI0032C1B293